MREIVTNELRTTLEQDFVAACYKNHGSFYLRIGAVSKLIRQSKGFYNIHSMIFHAVFGIGAMIYAALEFGQYFEMSYNPNCDDIMLAVQPFTRVLFTFFQMYFVFLNSKVIERLGHRAANAAHIESLASDHQKEQRDIRTLRTDAPRRHQLLRLVERHRSGDSARNHARQSSRYSYGRRSS